MLSKIVCVFQQIFSTHTNCCDWTRANAMIFQHFFSVGNSTVTMKLQYLLIWMRSASVGVVAVFRFHTFFSFFKYSFASVNVNRTAFFIQLNWFHSAGNFKCAARFDAKQFWWFGDYWWNVFFNNDNCTAEKETMTNGCEWAEAKSRQ